MQVHPKTSRVFRQHCLQRRWPMPHLRCAMRDGRLALVDRDAFEVEWWIELSQNERQVQGTMRKCHMELNLREFADLDCIRYLKHLWPVRINEDQWKAVSFFCFYQSCVNFKRLQIRSFIQSLDGHTLGRTFYLFTHATCAENIPSLSKNHSILK